VAKLNLEQLKERIAKAKANKALWESHLRECYEYALPERNTIDQWSVGSKKREKVFDDTAVEALEDFANRCVALLVPPSTKWMELEAGSEIPEEAEDEINQYLEESTETLFSHLDSSNFTSQIHDSFLDLGISTGAIIVEEGDGIQSALNFRSVSLSELILEKSSRGIVETVFREFKIPAKDIKSTWTRAKLTNDLKRIIKDNPTEEIELIEGVIKEGNGFKSILLYVKEDKILMEESLDFSPYIIFRESVIPGEVMGRGRVMRQLNNIKTLNRMKQDYLKGLSFQANPIFTATDDGIINPYTIKLAPGTIAPVGTNDSSNPTLRPLPMSGNPQLIDFAIRDLQDAIRRSLLSKPFGQIDETPVRTATEMSIRNADMAQTSLSASSRIQVELLERVVANCVNILKRAGKIADFKVNGKEVAIKFVNPSTRQQDEAELAAYGRFMEFMQGLPPEVVMQKIRIEEFPVNIADTLGLPESIKRTEMEMQQMAQQQQQMAQQQMMAEQQAAMSQQPQG